MTKADEIKKLVDRLEDSYYADEGPHINSVVASAELHAAIDAQQAEIDRLKATNEAMEAEIVHLRGVGEELLRQQAEIERLTRRRGSTMNHDIKEREDAFRADLAELLAKHRAELTITDDGKPYGQHSAIALVGLDGYWGEDESKHMDYVEFRL